VKRLFSKVNKGVNDKQMDNLVNEKVKDGEFTPSSSKTEMNTDDKFKGNGIELMDYQKKMMENIVRNKNKNNDDHQGNDLFKEIQVKDINTNHRRILESLYNDFIEDFTMKKILSENILNPVEGFIFYYLHYNHKVRFENDSLFQVFIEFLKEELNYSTTFGEINLLLDEKFLFLKNIILKNNYFSIFENTNKGNASFIGNIIVFSTSETLNAETIDYLAGNLEYKIVPDKNKYKIQFKDDFSLIMSIENKKRVETFMNREGERITKALQGFSEASKSLELNNKQMIYNFIKEIPKEFLLNREFFPCLEYYLSVNSYSASLVLETNSSHREASRIYFRDTIIIKTAQDIIEDNFNKLVRVMKSRVGLEENLTVAFIWFELKEQIKIYFSDLFVENYGSYFKRDELTKDNIIIEYCKIEEIDTLNYINIGYLTYYLMDIGVLKNGNFMSNSYMVGKDVEVIKESLNLISFEKRLMRSNENHLKDFNDIDVMTGTEFEQFVADLFSKMGYLSVVTKTSGDQGIDVIAEKNGKRFGIQSKCYGSKVNNSAVQEVVAGLSYYNCDKGIVVTNSYFTRSAIELAEKNNVILWDRDMLKEKFADFFY